MNDNFHFQSYKSHSNFPKHECSIEKPIYFAIWISWIEAKAFGAVAWYDAKQLNGAVFEQCKSIWITLHRSRTVSDNRVSVYTNVWVMGKGKRCTHTHTMWVTRGTNNDILWSPHAPHTSNTRIHINFRRSIGGCHIRLYASGVGIKTKTHSRKFNCTRNAIRIWMPMDGAYEISKITCTDKCSGNARRPRIALFTCIYTPRTCAFVSFIIE